MSRCTLDDIALVAEYPWRFGGSQRLLDTLARMWNKPIHLLPPAEPGVIWDTTARVGVPEQPVLLSIVVDALRPRLVPGKRHIKFCHSADTVDRYREDARLAGVQFMTHRRRVHDHYSTLGLPITYIRDGYIPYDPPELPTGRPAPTHTCCVTSRVSPDRIPVGYARALADLPFKVKILGSGQDGGHRDELRRAMSAGRHLDFVDPDLPEGLSERRKNEEMLKSSVMLHYTPSGMRDVLEYSILDALATGTVPVCISDDRHQLGTLTRHGIGPMVRRPADLPAAVEAAIENHDIYRSKGRDFLATFLDDQHALRQRWSDSTEKVLSTL